MIESIIDKVTAGERISDDEFLALSKDADLYQLAFLADSVRKRLHPDQNVTYVVDRNINYTDICISACQFCAFFKAPEESGGSYSPFPSLKIRYRKPRNWEAHRFFCRVVCIRINRLSIMRRCLGV